MLAQRRDVGTLWGKGVEQKASRALAQRRDVVTLWGKGGEQLASRALVPTLQQ